MKLMTSILAGAAGLALLSACTTPTDGAAVEAAVASASTSKLASVLDAQDDKAQARYDARHPAETLAFFGIEPGMTVVEALPGGGWYSKILLPYLGSDGTLVGAHYPDDMWANFGWDADRVAGRVKATAEWPVTAAGWGITNGASIESIQLTKVPDTMNGTADAVLFIRALHNMNRFEGKGGYMSKAIAESYTLLKPGGIVGVVQHQAPEGNAAASSDGSKGYLKKSDVIAKFTAAGFVLDGESDVNANAKDVPGNDDIVWRLPPSLATTEEGTAEQAAVKAIGESNRMTLRFRKPG